jgi:integrase
MLRPTKGARALAPKTVLEIHLIIRGALADAVRRGLVNRNVALVAHVPRLVDPKVEPETWTSAQLQAFSAAAVGHRLLPLWVLAATGMRGSELLGLKRPDVDLDKGAIKLNRGLVSVGYDLHESRGKTANVRRRIELDATTSKSSPHGDSGNASSGEQSVTRRRNGSSPTPPARSCTSMSSPRPSTASSPAPAYPESASTTCATPRRRCSSTPASP